MATANNFGVNITNPEDNQVKIQPTDVPKVSPINRIRVFINTPRGKIVAVLFFLVAVVTLSIAGVLGLGNLPNKNTTDGISPTAIATKTPELDKCYKNGEILNILLMINTDENYIGGLMIMGNPGEELENSILALKTLQLTENQILRRNDIKYRVVFDDKFFMLTQYDGGYNLNTVRAGENTAYYIKADIYDKEGKKVTRTTIPGLCAEFFAIFADKEVRLENSCYAEGSF